MNIFGIGLITIIGLCLWSGFRRGLFRTLLIVGAMILSMIGATYATPVVGHWIQEHTQIDERIETYVIQKLQLDPTQEDGKTAQMQIIDELPFPEGMKLAVINNNNTETYLAFQVKKLSGISGTLSGICGSKQSVIYSDPIGNHDFILNSAAYIKGYGRDSHITRN